jgi:hypothetical protein
LLLSNHPFEKVLYKQVLLMAVDHHKDQMSDFLSHCHKQSLEADAYNQYLYMVLQRNPA